MAAVGICVWMVGLIQSQQDTEGLNLQQMGMNLERQDDGEVLQQVSIAQMMKANYLALSDSLSVLEHRFSNQFFILQDETFNLKTTVSALTSQPNVKKF